MKKLHRTRLLKALAVTPLAALLPLHAGLLGTSLFSMSDSFPKKGMQKQEAQILVRFKDGVAQATKDAKHTAEGNQVIRNLQRNLQEVRISPAQPVDDAVANYKADPNVAFAEPNYTLRAMLLPNEPAFSQLWNLLNTGILGKAGADMKATQAWDRGTGSPEVVVMVIDSGVDYRHLDLAANMWVNPGEIAGNGVDDDGNGIIDDVHGANFVTTDPLQAGNPMDDFGHGTHVAGTIGAVGNNNLGVVGVNWNVKIAACKALDNNGEGTIGAAVRCLDYARDLKARGVNIVVTNNSYGGLSTDPDLTPERILALNDAIAAQPDILFAAAAGNSALDNDIVDFYPADYALPNVISVAATDMNDELPAFSHVGRRTVHVGAPGVGILSTLNSPITSLSNSYTTANGTSMATPHVAGLAALIKAHLGATVDAKAIKNLILAGGDPLASLQGKTITGRRLNADVSTNCTNKPFLSAVKLPAAFAVGVPGVVSAVSINCGTPVGPVTATTSTNQTIALLDDGVAPDQLAGDGEFTGTLTPNQAFGSITFSSTAGSDTVTALDLVPTVLTAPASANLGDSIAVNLTVANTSTASAAPATTANIYLSIDGVVTPADTLLGTVLVPGIPAGGQQSVIGSFTVPTGIPAGNYFIGAIADAPNAVIEGNEANNALAGNVIAVLAPPADLTLSAMTAPTTGRVGQTIAVSANVVNSGTATAAASTLTFYLSSDNVITTADRVLGTSAINALAGGASQLASGTVTIPAGTATGTYYVGAIADSANVVIESNENNNARAAANTTVVSAATVDLQVSAMSNGSTSRNSPAMNFSATLRNGGTTVAPASVMRWYLSTNNTLSADDRVLGSVSTGTLNAGSTRSLTLNTRIPVDVPAATYYVIAMADPDNLVGESLETNNVRVGGTRVAVSYTIDLTMTAVNATPAVVATGQNVTFTGTVRNAGGAAAGALTVGYYLSTDATITTSDRLIATSSVASLAAGASANVTATAALRTDLPPGTYYIGAIADPANLVAESNNNNNALANATARMTTSYGPDLVITAISAPSVGTRGTTVTITGTVNNQGTGAIGAATDRRVIESGSTVNVGIYLSTNTNITAFDTRVGDYTFSALGAGVAQPFTITVTIPALMARGNYYIGAIADRSLTLREASELNNALPGNLISVQ